MGGIRGHSPLESLPIVLIVVIVAVWPLRNRPGGFRIALAVLAGIGLLYATARIIDKLLRRRRRRRLERLRDLASAPPTDATTREAAALARRIIGSRSDNYGLMLDGMTSFVETAKGTSEAAGVCRQVLFRHAPWSTEMERDIAAMRYQLVDADYVAWLEWFLDAKVGWPEFADRIADASMYALPRIAQPERQRLLLRALNQAAPRESWRRFGQLFNTELHALDPESLTPHQRTQLASVSGAHSDPGQIAPARS